MESHNEESDHENEIIPVHFLNQDGNVSTQRILLPANLYLYQAMRIIREISGERYDADSPWTISLKATGRSDEQLRQQVTILGKTIFS